MDMKKLLMILALSLPLTLMAQEVKEEVKEEVVVKQGCTYNAEGICTSCQVPHLKKNKGFKIKKEIHFGSDRGDMKTGRMRRLNRSDEHTMMGKRNAMAKQKKMHKKRAIRSFVRIVVIGGIAYYVGYHQGEKHFKGGMGMKRRMGDKK
jgi:hypothetical protein